MKLINYLSLVLFAWSIQQCSANMIDNDGIGVIRKPSMHQRLLTERENNFDDYETGDIPEYYLLFKAGYEHTCTVIYTRASNSEGLKCWGSNGSGQLGLGDKHPRGGNKGEMGDNLPSVNLASNSYIIRIAVGGFHTCAEFEHRKAKCFGDNRYGQLALGDTNNRGDGPNEMGDNLPFVNVGKTLHQIVVGLFHSCILFDDPARVACFGNNQYGQLGIGNMISRGGSPNDIGPNTLYVNLETRNTGSLINGYFASGATANHTCFLSTDNYLLKCWGSNTKGQLGLGDTNNRGDRPNEMGDQLTKIQLPIPEWISEVYVGGANTCVVGADIVYCFGDNQNGQLGLGHTNNIGDEPNEMGDSLKPMNLGDEYLAMHVGVGSNHICVISTRHTMRCYGQNSYGQLGQGDTINRGESTSTIGNYLPIVNLGPSGTNPRQVVAGNAHTCVQITKKNLPDTIKCFGNGSNGVLGYEDINNRGDAPNEMGSKLPRVSLRYIAPSKSPTHTPTKKPVNQPTKFPTQPTTTKFPTRVPTTASPSRSPSSVPTKPTKKPTKKKKNGL